MGPRWQAGERDARAEIVAWARGGVERARSRAGWAKLGWFVCWAAGRERKGAGLGWWASGMGFGLGLVCLFYSISFLFSISNSNKV